MRPVPKIFVEVPVTYGEMIEVLTKLGYHQEFDGKNNRYVHEKEDSFLLLPVNSPDEILERAYVAVYSSRLYLQGIIKQEESLIHMIQKNREKTSKKQAKNRQIVA